MDHKKNSSFILIICFICMGSILLLNSKESDVPIHDIHDDQPRFADSTIYSWILIDDDISTNTSNTGNWDWASQQSWCTGDGTESHPYTISNIVINPGLYASTEPALHIGYSSNNYILIDNVTCTNSSSYGLYLDDLLGEITVQNSNFSYNFRGIQSQHRHSPIIRNNWIKNNSIGIYVDPWSGENAIIEYNTIINCQESGLYLNDADYTVRHNQIFNSCLQEQYFTGGIQVEDGDQIILYNNSITNSKFAGIFLDSSTNVEISMSNITQSGSAGVFGYYSSDTKISHCHINDSLSTGYSGSYNYDSGIVIFGDSSRYNVSFNNISNHQNAIRLISTNCPNTAIHDNQLFDNTNAGMRNLCSDSDIYNNLMFDNDFGIMTFDGDVVKNTNIKQNTIENNTDTGISISLASPYINTNINISDNQICNNNNDGIRFGGSQTEEFRFISIEHNQLIDNHRDGIRLAAKGVHANFTIFENTIQGSGEDGLHLYLAEISSIHANHTIEANTINENGHNGICVEGEQTTDINFLNNNLTANIWNGMCLNAPNNVFSENILQNNNLCGLNFTANYAYANIIFNNEFVGNSLHAYDAIDFLHPSHNSWNNSIFGNDWDNVTQANGYTDYDDNGKADQPYGGIGYDSSGGHTQALDYLPIFSDDPNTFPVIIAQPLAYYEHSLGNSILLQWNISDPEFHPTEAIYAVKLNETTNVTGESWTNFDNITFSTENLMEGYTKITLEVFDGYGGMISDELWVFVQVPPQLVSSPGNLEFEVDEIDHILTWEIMDFSTGTLNSRIYTIYQNEILYDSGTWSSQSPIDIPAGQLTMGMHNFTLIASDGKGANISDTVWISVNNTMPTIIHSPDSFRYFLQYSNNYVLDWNLGNDPSVQGDPDTFIGSLYINGTYQETKLWESIYHLRFDVDTSELGFYNYTVLMGDGYGGNVSDSVLVYIFPQMEIIHTPISDFTINDGVHELQVTSNFPEISNLVIKKIYSLDNQILLNSSDWDSAGTQTITLDDLPPGDVDLAIIIHDTLVPYDFFAANEMIRFSILNTMPSLELPTDGILVDDSPDFQRYQLSMNISRDSIPTLDIRVRDPNINTSSAQIIGRTVEQVIFYDIEWTSGITYSIPLDEIIPAENSDVIITRVFFVCIQDGYGARIQIEVTVIINPSPGSEDNDDTPNLDRPSIPLIGLSPIIGVSFMVTFMVVKRKYLKMNKST